MKRTLEFASAAAVLALTGCGQSTSESSSRLTRLSHQELQYAELRIGWFEYDGAYQECAEQTESYGGNVDVNCAADLARAVNVGVAPRDFEERHPEVVDAFNEKYQDTVVENAEGEEILAFQNRRCPGN